MLKRIKTLLKDNLIVISILITISIFILSLFRLPQTGIQLIHNMDKVQHCLAYFILTLSWLFTFYKTPTKKYIIILLCIILGIIIEILQYALTNYRTGDYIDVIANSIGVLLALFVFNLFLRKNKLINS